MNPANLFPSIRRSLGTAWTKQPEGPRWAPWAWTAALNVVIAALITVLVPRSGGFWLNLVASEAIGMTIHALFVGLGRALQLNQFAMPLALRLAYVVAVVMAGSWIGYVAAFWLLLGDIGRLMEHMSHASRYLIVLPALWAAIATTAFAGIGRLRARALARERERGEAIRVQREAIAARLALLNAQIEPHFLYNTLASVSALITADPPAARALLDALVGYLRASARNMARTLVPLADELESVRGYLAVMQRRLGARLTVRVEVPADALTLRVPPAALQTLVENAIKHGIEPATRGGEIAVRARPDDGGWRIEVADSGVGLRDAATPGASTGTGLANLGERLRLALGPGAGVTLQSRPGGGALAEIVLPASAASAASAAGAAGDAAPADRRVDDASPAPPPARA
ncbi:MAG: histidine kinase [Burkholderiaceae bacterium]